MNSPEKFLLATLLTVFGGVLAGVFSMYIMVNFLAIPLTAAGIYGAVFMLAVCIVGLNNAMRY